MFQRIPVNDEKIFAFKATGKLTDADYKKFIPELESAIEKQGALSVYLQLEDFHGWEPKAAWDDFKIGLKHGNDFRKIAIVGEKKWERWMATLGKAFTGGRIEFFNHEDAPKAWDWLREQEEETETETEEQKDTYQKILAAIDFSDHSGKTVKKAVELAKKYDAELMVLHALRHITRYDRSFELLVVPDEAFETDEIIFERAEKKMDELTGKIGYPKLKTEIIWGRSKSTILFYAEAQQADLIVMGSHGHHGLARMLGSTTNGVINNARCDVLVVRT